MRMYNAPPFFAPSHLICPDCREPMRLADIMPSPTQYRADEISYRCDACKQVQKQVTKPLEDA
jgi:hypothetical protein